MISSGQMARHPPKRTCEDCLAIDVREWQRAGLLRHGRDFSCSWSRLGRPLGKVDVAPRSAAVVLQFRARGATQEQHIRLTWTRCTFGFRPWFRCGGCGRRAAKLYLGHGALFACRLCQGLGYRSQLESPRHRAISKAQKLRLRLGGGPSFLDPFPSKPPRMHWRTFYRLFNKAAEAQEHSMALALEDLRRRYPEPNRGSMVVS
jgi:hypothetical protein